MTTGHIPYTKTELHAMLQREVAKRREVEEQLAKLWEKFKAPPPEYTRPEFFVAPEEEPAPAPGAEAAIEALALKPNTWEALVSIVDDWLKGHPE